MQRIHVWLDTEVRGSKQEGNLNRASTGYVQGRTGWWWLNKHMLIAGLSWYLSLLIDGAIFLYVYLFVSLAVSLFSMYV